MLTEIILTAKIGSFTVMRMPGFKYCSGRRLVSYADMLITDIDYELYKTLHTEERITVRFGYRTGEQAEKHFTVTGISAYSKDTVRIIALGEEYPLVSTFITESFNNEQPAAIIRHLASIAGLQTEVTNITDEPLPHIIFSNVTLFQALQQLRNIVLRNGGTDDNDFWMYDDKLNWGSHRHPVASRASVYGNIISHNVRTDGMNLLELPLTPLVRHSETISISDSRRAKQGNFTINAVKHIFDGTETRTWCEYR